MPTTRMEEPEPSAELYVRSLAPDGIHAHQESVVERLEHLESRGDVASFSLRVWGSRVVRSSSAAGVGEGRDVRRRLETFETWADRNGMSLEGPFREETVRSTITGEEYTAVTLPAMTLAEYADGELRFVAPCCSDGVVHTVDDRLGALDATVPDARAATAGGGGREDREGATSEPF